MASQQELSIIYAALALQDDDKAITSESIQALLNAAGVTVEPFWIGLYVNALKGVDVKDLVQKIGSGAGSAAAAPAAGSAAAPSAADVAPAKEEKKKEAAKEESEDEDMGFGLFD